MASIDDKFLFTNIPLTVTTVTEHDKLIPYNLTTLQFKSLLEFCLKQSAFVFNDQLYKQLDGVAMGSSLGPTLANAFLYHHEKSCYSDCLKEFRSSIYKRYADYCFLAFKEKIILINVLIF